jgi:hypothetical protein
MQRTENGLLLKVIGGSSNVEAKKVPGGTEAAFTLELLQPYFVICEAGDTWRITDLRTDSVDDAMQGKVGYVDKSQVHLWTTREALAFTPLIRSKDRPEIAAWDDRGVFDGFMASADSSANPPAFREKIFSGLRGERSYRPYPVIEIKTERFGGSVDKDTYRVLAPVNLPNREILIGRQLEWTIEDSLAATTIVFALDVTASLGPFIEKLARSIQSTFDRLPESLQNKVKIGFVFFRDKEDSEKIVITPGPVPMPDAAELLSDIAKYGVTGGGDVAEPILDAVYVAAHLYPWTTADKFGLGKRAIIATLAGDAKTITESAIDERVPTGLDAESIGFDLLGSDLPVISVQLGSDDGGDLVKVLSTLAKTSNGHFIEWKEGQRPEVTADAIADAIKKIAVSNFRDVNRILSAMRSESDALPTIPLVIVDGAKLDRPRRDGAKFNIEDGKDGVLVREGFMLDNELLLKRQIEIEKSTLQALVKLFSALAIAGADAESLKKSAGEAIAAIASDDYDPKEPIGTLVSKKLGINFNTLLLDFDLDYLIAMPPSERDILLKQIRQATERLDKFLADHQDDLSSLPAIWMDAELLP